MEKLRLKSSSVHIKFLDFMMKWIWNFDKEDFAWGCPYVWLSALNLIIFLPFSFFKIIVLGVLKAWTQMKELTRRNRDKWCATVYDKLRNNPDRWSNFAKNQHCTEFLVWLGDRRNEKGRMLTADFEMYGEIARLRKEYMISKYTKTKIIDTSNKTRLNKILKYAKPVGIAIIWILVIAVAIFLGWVLYHLVILLIHAPAVVWKNAGITLLIVGAAVTIVGLAVVGCKRIGKSDKFIDNTESIGNGFVNVFKSIGKAFTFIKNLVKNACPAIERVD